MTATETLRALLDERGVEYFKHEDGEPLMTDEILLLLDCACERRNPTATPIGECCGKLVSGE